MKFSHYPKSDRRIIAVLAGVIAILAITKALHHPSSSPLSDATCHNAAMYEDRYAERADSFARLRKEREQQREAREARYLARKDSFAQLKREREQARLLREQVYQTRKDSFARLKSEREAAKALREARYQHYRDSLQSIRPIKLSAGKFIYLNQADTTLLSRVPGIGRGLAHAIVAYRRLLGGFARTEQVLEVQGVPATAISYLRVKSNEQTRLLVNRLSVAQLRRHPYLNFYQAKAIYEYRRKYGPLTNLRQLALLQEFTEVDFNRLEPYASYE